MPTWLITGCSSGLGRSLAEAVLARGYSTVVTARDAGKVVDLQQAHPDTALALALDVTDQAQVDDAVTRAEERFGAVDVLVNNAGHGYRAAVEEGDEAEVEALFATNFFGAVRMINAVLPGMRSRRAGAIVNISSIAARTSPPGSGYYAATKAALVGLTASLHKEVAPLGITTTIVEPGAFRTDFGGRSLQQAEVAIADYADTAGRRRRENTATGSEPGDPTKAAAALVAAVEDPHPPHLLLLGADAVDWFRAAAEEEAQVLASWEQLSRGTGHAATKDSR